MKPPALMLPFDGSAAATAALSAAIAHCRQENMPLGVAATRPWFLLMATATSAAVLGPRHDHVVVNAALRRVPDDVGLRYVTCGRCADKRVLADAARRLGCDAIVLPYRRWRAWCLARGLAQAGFRVYTVAPGQRLDQPSAGGG